MNPPQVYCDLIEISKLLTLIPESHLFDDIPISELSDLVRIIPSFKLFIKVPEFDVEEDNFESIKELDDTFRVEKRGGEYYVEGELILKIIGSTNFEDYESLQFFQNALRSNGVIKALEDAGINEGDTVKMYDIEFDFVF